MPRKKRRRDLTVRGVRSRTATLNIALFRYERDFPADHQRYPSIEIKEVSSLYIAGF